ncbi:MAG: lipocalin family protein [Prevotellaceae bacterium]|jgi:hypothetical protein|nr:lipocalin family protein [Prevotellaceae bacterium]GHT35604.1 hypothetical protein FACS189434_13650 [Bacteroidia bacterium]
MKKTLLMAALFAASMVTFTSCDKDKDDNKFSSSDLVGTWVVTEEIEYQTVAGVKGEEEKSTYTVDEKQGLITFNADGTFVDEDKITGKWELKGNALTLKYDEEEHTLKIASLSSSTLVVEDNETGSFGGVSFGYYYKVTFKKI